MSYVYVKTAKGGKDQKSAAADTEPVPTTIVPHQLKNMLMGKGNGKGKLANLKIDLWVHAEVNSTANTALTAVVNVDPSASAEFNSLAALYDEVIVHGGRVFHSLVSTGGTAFEAHWSSAYDPTDNTAYGSYVAVLSASQKLGPMRATAPPTTSLQCPIAVTKNGHVSYTFKCPKLPQKTLQSATANDNLCTGYWTSTAFGTFYYGFVKPYVEAAGTGVVTSLATTLCMHCEFRSRT